MIRHGVLSPVENTVEKRRDAFTLNYVALILIILCFSATFTVGPKMELELLWAGNTPDKASYPKAPESTPFSDLTYTSLFSQGTSELDGASLDALASALLQHDINVEISLYMSPDADSYELVVARSVTLFRALVRHGVPAYSIQLASFERGSETQAQVRFHWEEGER